MKDAVYILGSPGRWTGRDWAVAGGAAAGLIVVAALADRAVRDQTQNHKSGALDDLTRIVEPFGSEYSYAVLGAYGVVGLVFHDADSRDTAIDGVMASVLASGIVTPSLKLILGRARPNQTDDTLSFQPFHSGYASLPSGHATQAFAVASVISAHSGQALGQRLGVHAGGARRVLARVPQRTLDLGRDGRRPDRDGRGTGRRRAEQTHPVG